MNVRDDESRRSTIPKDSLSFSDTFPANSLDWRSPRKVTVFEVISPLKIVTLDWRSVRAVARFESISPLKIVTLDWRSVLAVAISPILAYSRRSPSS